jgi:hypothetical protein
MLNITKPSPSTVWNNARSWEKGGPAEAFEMIHDRTTSDILIISHILRKALAMGDRKHMLPLMTTDRNMAFGLWRWASRREDEGDFELIQDLKEYFLVDIHESADTF